MIKIQILAGILFIVLPVYVASLKSCFQCSGTECVALPSEFKSVTCPNEDDECVTIFNGFTPIKRDCSSSLTNAENLICSTATNNLCNKCNNADNCNYLSRNDHKCIYCSSLADQRCLTDPSSMTTVQCAATTLNKGLCYVKSIGMTTERGCLTERTSQQSCEKQPESCSICELNAVTPCNNYEYPTNRRKCYQCTNAECTVAQIAPTYCDNPSDNCVVMKSTTNHKLACEKQMSATEQLYCANNPSLCFHCNTNGCNTPTIDLSGVTCHSCSSDTDSQCVLHPNTVKTVSCQSGCYTKLTNGQTQIISRDCLEKLSAADQTLCTDENDSATSICRKCGTANCNSEIFPKDRLSCHKCVGDCSTSVQQICSTYEADDKCMIAYLNKYHTHVTHADCQSAINVATECADDSCTACTTANCNNPAESIKPITCGSCNSSINPKCANEVTAVESIDCKVVTMETNKCYMRIVNTMTSRGCASELQSIDECLAQNGLCTICDEPNCNKEVYPANRLRCHVCDSLSDPNCDANHSTKTPTICPNYYDDATCYTYVTREGLINRGCAKQSGFTCTNNYQLCLVCNSSGCNSQYIDLSTTTTTTTTTVASNITTTSTPNANVTIPNNITTTTTRKPNAAITFNFNFYLLFLTIFFYLINCQ